MWKIQNDKKMEKINNLNIKNLKKQLNNSSRKILKKIQKWQKNVNYKKLKSKNENGKILKNSKDKKFSVNPKNIRKNKK